MNRTELSDSKQAMNRTELSDSKQAVLQRFLLARFYPNMYYRYLSHVLLNDADVNTTKETMSKPVDLTLEFYVYRQDVVYSEIPLHVRRYISRCFQVDIKKLVYYMNFSGDLDEIIPQVKALDDQHKILLRILPKFKDRGYCIYKQIDPIWVSEDDDIFTVQKPYVSSLSGVTTWDGNPDPVRFHGKLPRRQVQMSDGPAFHILEIENLPYLQQSALENAGHDDYLLDEGLKFTITRVRRSMYGHIIVSGTVIVPGDHLEDFSSGGGNSSRQIRSKFIRNALRSPPKKIQNSSSVSTTSSVAMVLSLAIIATSSLFPR
jgi:hypothetical protein